MVVDPISGEHWMMELKKSGAHSTAKGGDNTESKQFTQGCVPLDTQLQCRATKWDMEQGAGRHY